MFKGQLFEAQKFPANLLCRRRSLLLAAEQGTGKTVISLASAERLRELGYLNKPALVICPSGITWQWQDKIGEFTDDNCSLVTAKDRSSRQYDANKAYTITSYNLFRRDFDRIIKRPWGLVICDEAQEFKNNKSKTAQLLKQFNREVKPEYRWALTGTVISNKLEELYSIMYWVDKDFLPSWPSFEERHIVRNPNTNQIMKYKNLKSLWLYLPKRMIRITQQDLGDQMPEIVEQTIYIEKDKELKDAENRLLGALDSMAERIQLDTNGSLRGTSRDSAVSTAFHDVKTRLASTSKTDTAVHLARKILEENSQNKVVIFSFYKDPLYSLETEFNDKVSLFTGDHDTAAKRAAISEFKEGKSRILLASNAGKAGLDLPFANYVIHLDIPFSWEVLDQRNKRITRASSKFSTAKVIYLVVKDSIEGYYYQVVKRKGQLADAVYYGTNDSMIMKPQSLRTFINGVTTKL